MLAMPSGTMVQAKAVDWQHVRAASLFPRGLPSCLFQEVSSAMNRFL